MSDEEPVPQAKGNNIMEVEAGASNIAIKEEPKGMKVTALRKMSPVASRGEEAGGPSDENEDNHASLMMDWISLTDPCVVDQVINNQKEAQAIVKDVRVDKEIVQKLANKKDLVEQDRVLLNDSLARLMAHVKKLNGITRTLKQSFGLVDP